MEQSIQQLAKELSLKLEALGEGMLSIDDVAPLVDDAREVYERLIALRYAAIERAVNADAMSSVDELDDAGDDRVAFRLTDVLPGQTSLIDAIEEIQRENGESCEPDVAEDEANNAELNLDSDEEGPVPAAQKTPVESFFQEENAVQKERAAHPADEMLKAVDIPRPSNPKNLEKSEKTIADRLRRTPIEDLRKAIGINQRFQFLNELFSGDNECYVRTIDEVNSAESLAAALTLLGAANERLAQPDDDDAVAQALLQLVERRFL